MTCSLVLRTKAEQASRLPPSGRRAVSEQWLSLRDVSSAQPLDAGKAVIQNTKGVFALEESI